MKVYMFYSKTEMSKDILKAYTDSINCMKIFSTVYLNKEFCDICENDKYKNLYIKEIDMTDKEYEDFYNKNKNLKIRVRAITSG